MDRDLIVSYDELLLKYKELERWIVPEEIWDDENIIWEEIGRERLPIWFLDQVLKKTVGKDFSYFWFQILTGRHYLPEPFLSKVIDLVVSDVVELSPWFYEYVHSLISSRQKLSVDFIIRYAEHLDVSAAIRNNQHNNFPEEFIIEMQLKGYI